MYEIGYKALFDGYEFKTRKSDTKRYDVICRNDDTIKLLGHLLELKLKDNIRIYKGKEIKHDIYTDLNIDITYKQAWRSKNVALESLSGCHVASFAQLPYYCHNLEMINDGAVTHIETDNEDRFKMVFIAFGVLGETGPSWTWFLSKLKECIGEVPNLHLLMNYKLKGIRLHCLFWKMCKAYLPEDFNMAINELGATRPDIYHKLTEAGVEKWSRAYCPNAPLNELSDWATAKITKRRQKSVNWIVGAIDRYRVYHVDDHRRMHTVELYSDTCTCRKWQLSGLPCGHVLAVCRVMGLTYFNHLAKGWLRRKALEGTYQELVYPVGEVSSWQRPNYLQVVKPPLMDKNQLVDQRAKLVLYRKAKTGYSEQEHYYSEQEHYYSQQAMSFSFEAVDLNDP
ncbi:transposase, MuDR, MULE transposase domain protein [Tanacetum coccineum]